MTESEIPSGDLYGFTQLNVGDDTEPARAVGVEDGPLVTGGDGPTIEAGGSADIFYQLSGEETAVTVGG